MNEEQNTCISVGMAASDLTCAPCSVHRLAPARLQVSMIVPGKNPSRHQVLCHGLAVLARQAVHDSWLPLIVPADIPVDASGRPPARLNARVLHEGMCNFFPILFYTA